jgi:hypothetical protein
VLASSVPMLMRLYNHQHAAHKAQEAIPNWKVVICSLPGSTYGTSRVNLGDYLAQPRPTTMLMMWFTPPFPSAARPWRMTWYQTGPYAAYYHTGRYQDVIDLATFTLVNTGVQEIEETWLWRGRARLALGDEPAPSKISHSPQLPPGWEPKKQNCVTWGSAHEVITFRYQPLRYPTKAVFLL